MLSFDPQPDFLRECSVVSYQVNQRLGEVGTLCVDIHRNKPSGRGVLADFAALEENLGKKFTCKEGEWGFVGTLEEVDYDDTSGNYRLVFLDPLARLDKVVASRVFAEQSLGDIVYELIPSDQSYEFLGSCDSCQVRMAIQYQESNLVFLKRLLSMVEAQVWCQAEKIVIGSLPRQEQTSLRLGRDVIDYSMGVSLGVETVELNELPYVDNSSQISTLELGSDGLGKVQKAAVKARKKMEEDKTLHLIHEDSTYDDAALLARSYLKQEGVGRLRLWGELRKPVTLGSEVKIESRGASEGESEVSEPVVVTALQGSCDHATHMVHWSFEGVNPQAFVSSGTASPDRMIYSAAVVEDSKDALNRVRVFFPWDKAERSTPWLRIATPSWGSGHFHYLPPKAGDVVLVVWGQRDMDPVVLGSLAAGEQIDSTSEVFSFITSEGHKVTVGDSDIKILNEADGGGSSVEIKPDKILVKTQQGQTVEVGSGKLKLDTGQGSVVEIEASRIKLTSAGQVIIEGPAGIQLKTPMLDVG